jgi:hypothetical protein
MGFQDAVVDEAWKNAHDKADETLPLDEARCEHCQKLIRKANRGSKNYGWQAHQKIVGKGYTVDNCEILCWGCYKPYINARSEFGV